jgi:hypothetical protein
MNHDLLPVEVDCRFAADGTVRVRRIRLDGRWQPVEQGRQWEDDDGRHVLVMLPGGPVRRLWLDRTTLRWEMAALSGKGELGVA